MYICIYEPLVIKSESVVSYTVRLWTGKKNNGIVGKCWKMLETL